MDSDLKQCWNCRKNGRFHCEKCDFAFYCSKKCEQKDCYRHEVECERLIQMRTCSGCGQRPSVLLRCGSCFLAFYCNKACQSRHWPQHKDSCTSFRNGALERAAKQVALSKMLNPSNDLPWYIGLANAEDYLRLHQNEGSSTERELRLLFVGVGDIKDIVRTITDLPAEFMGKLHFVLNDHGPHVSARNLLFTYCALVAPMAEYLVHIWYSLYLTPKVLKYIVVRLKELTTMTPQEVLDKMRNYIYISSDQWSQCVQIWKGWYQLALDTEAAEKMLEIRHKIFSGLCESIGMFSLLGSIPKEHHQSVMDFMEKGLLFPLKSPERRDAVFPNCTMACYNPFNPKYDGKFVDISQSAEYMGWREVLRPTEEMVYGIRSDAYVMNCWDYLVVMETVGKKDDVLDMYLSYLTGLFQTFIDKIGSGCVTFRFIVDDFRCLDRYFAKNETFDRISISNLSDYYCYPLLLKQFGPRLNKHNKCSAMITHHENWSNFSSVYADIGNAPEYVFERGYKDAKQRPQVLAGVIMKNLAIRGMGICAEDYFDTTPYFLSSLLSDVVAYSARYENKHISKELIKHPAQVAQMFGLQLRDYCCELNHVVPFKRENITRHVSLQKNNKRYLEWTLSSPAIPLGLA